VNRAKLQRLLVSIVYSAIVTVVMLLSAFLLCPYCNIVGLPLLAALLYGTYRIILWIIGRISAKLRCGTTKAVCLVSMLLLSMAQFFYFQSESKIFEKCVGELASRATVVDHYVHYFSDSTFAFLLEGSDDALEELLSLKDFGAPEEVRAHIGGTRLSMMPKKFRAEFENKKVFKYEFMDERGTFFYVFVTEDRRNIVYQIVHT